MIWLPISSAPAVKKELIDRYAEAMYSHSGGATRGRFDLKLACRCPCPSPSPVPDRHRANLQAGMSARNTTGSSVIVTIDSGLATATG